jgi:hypothetical protein
VNLQLGCSFAPRKFNIFELHGLATAPDFVSNRQQRFELVRNCRTAGILFDIVNQLFIATEMIGRDRAMDSVSKETIVLPRNIAGDKLPLAPRKRARPLQQNFCQFIEWLRGFWPKRHWAQNSRQSFG